VACLSRKLSGGLVARRRPSASLQLLGLPPEQPSDELKLPHCSASQRSVISRSQENRLGSVRVVLPQLDEEQIRDEVERYAGWLTS
jgi:hypothetical protein